MPPLETFPPQPVTPARLSLPQDVAAPPEVLSIPLSLSEVVEDGVPGVPGVPRFQKVQWEGIKVVQTRHWASPVQWRLTSFCVFFVKNCPGYFVVWVHVWFSVSLSSSYWLFQCLICTDTRSKRSLQRNVWKTQTPTCELSGTAWNRINRAVRGVAQSILSYLRRSLIKFYIFPETYLVLWHRKIFRFRY